METFNLHSRGCQILSCQRPGALATPVFGARLTALPAYTGFHRSLSSLQKVDDLFLTEFESMFIVIILVQIITPKVSIDLGGLLLEDIL